MAIAALGREEDLIGKPTLGGEKVNARARKKDDGGSVSVDSNSAGRENFHSKGEPAGLLLGRGHAEVVRLYNPSRKKLGGPQEADQSRVYQVGGSQLQPLYQKWRTEQL